MPVIITAKASQGKKSESPIDALITINSKATSANCQKTRLSSKAKKGSIHLKLLHKQYKKKTLDTFIYQIIRSNLICIC